MLDVEGAGVTEMRRSPASKNVLVTCIAKEEDTWTGFRFLMPAHARTVRDFFKEAGVKWTGGPAPRDESYTVEAGAFLIVMQGTIIGTDNVPENPKGEMPSTIYVLKDVRTRVIRMED